MRDDYRRVLVVASAAALADAMAAPRPLPRFNRATYARPVDGCGCGECRAAWQPLLAHSRRRSATNTEGKE